MSEPKPIPADVLENFERAFGSRSNGCVRDCACGKTYFDNWNDGYDWEEGELERLRETAIPLKHAVGGLIFEGKEYVDGCECWHARARAIICFIQGHDTEIADFLSLEKKRKQREADNAPTVE